MRARLGEIERLQQVLPAVGRVAGGPVQGCYLVGGAVRDVLLGEQSLDLDLMVEGDAIEFARALAASWASRAIRTRSSRPRSSRGAIAAANEVRIDVATARTEFYGAPGALPGRRALDASPRHGQARLHDQRDGHVADARRPSARPTTSSAAIATCAAARFASSTTSASSRIRPGCSARSATRRGSGSRWTATPCRSRAGASRCASSATSRRRACATS